MRTNLTKTMIKKAVSSDQMKENLTFAYLDTDKGLLRTCRNGHSVINYKVECENDMSGYIKPESFQTVKKGYSEIKIDGDNVTSNLADGSQIQLKTDQDRCYPDIEQVTPNINDNHLKIGINLQLLKNIYDSVPFNSDRNKNIVLHINPNNSRSAIIFKQQLGANDMQPAYDGLIMPVRID